MQKGVLFLLADYAFRKYFVETYDDNILHEEESDCEYLMWYIEEILEFLDFHRIQGAAAERGKLLRYVNHANKLFDLYQEDKYYNYLERKFGDVVELLCVLRAACNKYIYKLRDNYCTYVAERLLNDRELCAWIAKLIVISYVDNPPSKWCERETIPVWVRQSLMIRERGKCSNCGTELQEDPVSRVHVDHIIPLAVGGFNDIVNLQLLCERCNLAKNKKIMPTRPNIPKYLSKKLTGKSSYQQHKLL